MADLEALKAKVLEDGVIDDEEARSLREVVFADGVIDKDEVEALAQIRTQAKSVSDSFENLFFEAVRKNVLQDGTIDTEEAAWLRKALFADGKIDDRERQLLRDLKDGAKQLSPEFEALCRECLG